MTYWQVQADLGEGRQMVFGISAPDREAAQAGALLVLEDAGAAGMQVTELLAPLERI